MRFRMPLLLLNRPSGHTLWILHEIRPRPQNGRVEFAFWKSLANDQCVILAEISNDLANWNPADLARSAQTLHPDQTVTETWSSGTLQEAARVFLRLKLLPR